MEELQNIQDYIHVIRGHRVMLDRDIATFYGVETKRLNEKVKRNPKRFAGEDFMFQLTKDEWEDIRSRSQICDLEQRPWQSCNLQGRNATLKPRKHIGFIKPEENDEEDKEEKK